MIPLENIPYLGYLFVSQGLGSLVWVYACLRNNLLRQCFTYAIDVCEGNLYSLISRDINTSYTCHVTTSLPLSLFMFWVIADNSQHTLSFDYFAFITSLLYGRFNFHRILLFNPVNNSSPTQIIR